jgi:hypothetical protein
MDFYGVHDYNVLEERCNKLQQQLELAKRLHDIGGVPYSLTVKYKEPIMKSGYTMGEEIIVKCNGQIIDRINNCMNYPKSCKYNAKHGKITINFTKKGLREYIERANKFFDDENWKKLRDLVFKSVEKNNTICKYNKVIFFTDTLSFVDTNYVK